MQAVRVARGTGDVVLQGPWGKQAPGEETPYRFAFSKPLSIEGGEVSFAPEGVVLTLYNEKGEVEAQRTLPYPKPPRPTAEGQ